MSLIRTFTLLLLLAAITARGQNGNVEFDKNLFQDKKDGLRDVMRKLEQGRGFFEAGRKAVLEARRQYLVQHRHYPISLYDYSKAGFELFKQAIPLLMDAQRVNPNNARLNYELGLSNFFTNLVAKESMDFFEKAHLLGAMNCPTDLYYWLGWSCQLSSQWPKALDYYTVHLKGLQVGQRPQPALIEEVKKRMTETECGKQLSIKPERVFIDNLGVSVNSSFPEYGASITADESTIIFTARRPNSTGGKKLESDGGYFEDVYISYKQNGKWQPAKSISKSVNTDSHDAAAGLSPDGSKLFIYRHSGTDGGDLYQSVLNGTEWEVPVHMNKNINTRWHESSVSLSYDGKRLYFISDRESGYGDRDIYCCELDANGEWGPARNLGPEINTKYAEEAVFMHPDGVTMYFSSKGHNSMGGYDVFKSTLVNGKWTKPVNLGYPINGPDDDVFFVVSGSGNHAYFASAKQDGHGEKDLYKITFLGPEKEPMLNTQDHLIVTNNDPKTDLKVEKAPEAALSKLTLLKGIVVEDKSGKPIRATIELIDNEKNEVIAIFQSNSSTGRYLVTLPSGRNYGIAVKADGYLFHSENFVLPESADYQEFELNIGLKGLDVGSVVVLKNIFYDIGKASIRPESENELTRLIALLKEHPGMKIQIASHTDNVGGTDYNARLSESRSQAVVAYLVERGVPATRLSFKGFGESQPIAPNDSEDGRQKNRRTEFTVLSR